MANLKSLKSSITDITEAKRIELVILSRQRRIGFKSKPKKKVNKKIIGALSQEQKAEILKLMNAVNTEVRK